jgi:hypothetical protein
MESIHPIGHLQHSKEVAEWHLWENVDTHALIDVEESHPAEGGDTVMAVGDRGRKLDLKKTFEFFVQDPGLSIAQGGGGQKQRLIFTELQYPHQDPG